jgi:hypothetical protein
MMNTIRCLVLLLFITSYAGAQTLTLEKLHYIKSIYSPDYVELPDSKIVYPVTGLTEIVMRTMMTGAQGAMGGGVFADVELWVIDATGRIVYNSSYMINTTSTTNTENAFDLTYLRYMQKNGRKQLVQRHK